MNKPDYEHERSKAKRAADLIEFAEKVLRIIGAKPVDDESLAAARFDEIVDAAEELGL